MAFSVELPFSYGPSDTASTARDDLPTSQAITQGTNMPSPGYSVSGTDDFADLDEVFQQSDIVAGKQVDDFARALDKHTVLRGSAAEKRAQLFKLVDYYYDYSCKRADTLRAQAKNSRRSIFGGVKGYTAPPAQSTLFGAPAESNTESDAAKAVRTVKEQLQEVEGEAQTWDLLRRLLPLRYRDAHHTSNVRSSIEPGPRSRSEFWDEFVVADTSARERKVVLEWLQNTASRGPPIDEVVKELHQNADRGDILSHSWLHTRAKMKLQKSVNGYQGVLDPSDPALAHSHLGSNTLITQLDPDAMTRQGRKLEPQDDFFERSIWLGCFEMLRRGRSMAEIRDWCVERQEAWRAASISALSLSNPQDEDVEGQDFVPILAILWRRMCFAAARDGGHSDHERAVYGLLSGDITSVERVAKTWDDLLFLHYNALLRTQFDNFLIKQSGAEGISTAQAFPSFNAIQHHGDPGSLGRRLISMLEGSEKTRQEALTPSKALQGAIVANDLDRFLYNQGAVIAKDARELARKQKEDAGLANLFPNFGGPVLEDVWKSSKYVKMENHEALRVLTHIFIIITNLDELMGPGDHGVGSKLGSRSNYQEHILAAYTHHLKNRGAIDLVPLYASKLNGDRIYDNLVRNFGRVTDHIPRENHLGVMKRLGLDLDKFALTGPRVWLADVNEEEASCEAKGNFKILRIGPSQLEFGRLVKTDFFGEDPDFIDEEDDLVIRSIEWMMLIPGLFDETVDYVIRAHVYFLKRMHLRAARSLTNRVSLKNIVTQKTHFPMPQELDDMTIWMNEFLTQVRSLELAEDDRPRRAQHYDVKILWQLESLVNALDRIENLASHAQVVRENRKRAEEYNEPYAPSKDQKKAAASEVPALKSSMEPLLKNWLTDIYGPDVPDEIQGLREAYIPETVLAYISTLQFVGTFATRDCLMECMDLAVVIADKNSDVTAEFLRSGRMKELVEAFACVSKALAISTEEKGGRDTIAKKNREMGWSRELWSVQH